MVRLCSKSSRPYSGRPLIQARLQKRARRPAMTRVRGEESAEAVVPRATSRITKRPEASQTQEGPNLAGRHDHRWSCSGSDEADWPSYRQRLSWQRKSDCVIPQGLSGTAGRGPACPVVWEAGGATLPPTRLGRRSLICVSGIAKTLSG